MSSFIRNYGGNPAANASGLKSIQRALDAGLTVNQIRDMAAREGVSWGYRAQDFLNARGADKFVSKYGGNEDSMRNAGMQSVNRALAAGLTWQQIEQQARNEGISWGYQAQDFFKQKNEERVKQERQAEFDRLNSFQQKNDSISSPDSVYKTPDNNKSWIKRDFGNDNTPDYVGMQMKTPVGAKGETPAESTEPTANANPYSTEFLQGKIDKFKNGFREKKSQFGLDLKGGNRASRGEGNEPWLQVRKMREDRRRGYGGKKSDGGESFDRRD